MGRRKENVIHWRNPPNPYFDAYLDTWRAYTYAYHNNAPKHIIDDLLSIHKKAKEDYANYPQKFFSNKDINLSS